MLVSTLIQEIDEFRERLKDHDRLWAKSLAQPMPDFPVRNLRELEAQTDWLTRRLGALRPFIERFDENWSTVKNL